jgi:hypothetical protein
MKFQPPPTAQRDTPPDARTRSIASVMLADHEKQYASGRCRDLDAERFQGNKRWLISADTIAVKTRHIKRNTPDDFNATMEEVRRLAMTQEGKMRISVESKVDDPRASIITFGRRFGLTSEETQQVQNAWDCEPGYTLWAVIQAFTYAAKGNHLSAEQAYRFQRTGGMILSLVK